MSKVVAVNVFAADTKLGHDRVVLSLGEEVNFRKSFGSNAYYNYSLLELRLTLPE